MTNGNDIVREYYGVQTRKYSSNIVVHVTEYEVQKKGKTATELVKRIVCIPTERKVYGDKMAIFIAEQLNNDNRRIQTELSS